MRLSPWKARLTLRWHDGEPDRYWKFFRYNGFVLNTGIWRLKLNLEVWRDRILTIDPPVPPVGGELTWSKGDRVTVTLPHDLAEYLGAAKCQGQIMFRTLSGNYKVELLGTGSQDSEGHNMVTTVGSQALEAPCRS